MPTDILQQDTLATSEFLQDPKYQSLKAEAAEHSKRSGLWGAGSVLGTLGAAGAGILGAAAAATPLVITSAVIVGLSSLVLAGVSAVKGVQARMAAKQANEKATDELVRLHVSKVNGAAPEPAIAPEEPQQKLQPELQDRQPEPAQVQLIAAPEIESDPLKKVMMQARKDVGRDDESNAYYDVVLSAQKRTIVAEINDLLRPEETAKDPLVAAKSRPGK